MRLYILVALALVIPATVEAANAPPPLIDIGGRPCWTTPDIAHATPLPFGGARDFDEDFDFESNDSCLTTHDGAALFKTYRLPALAGQYEIAIASNLTERGIVPLTVVLTDAQGNVKRILSPDAMVFRQSRLGYLFRSHTDESFMVVETTPSMVGKSLSYVAESMNIIPISVITATVAFYGSIHIGSDNDLSVVFSHSGTGAITLAAIPTVQVTKP